MRGQRNDNGGKDYKGRMLHNMAMKDPGRGQGSAKPEVR